MAPREYATWPHLRGSTALRAFQYASASPTLVSVSLAYCERALGAPAGTATMAASVSVRGGPIVGVRVGLTILLAASALLSLVAAAAWLIGVFPEREAVGQTSRDPSITAPPSVSPAPKTPSPSPSSSPAAGPEDVLGNALGNPSASAQADNPASIPDLGVMDVIGNLKYFATDVDFRCTGPTVTEGDNILWSCAANARGGRGSYDVTLVGDDPLTILSVPSDAPWSVGRNGGIVLLLHRGPLPAGHRPTQPRRMDAGEPSNRRTDRNGGDSALGIRYQRASDPRGRRDRRLLEPRHMQVFAVASFAREPGAEPVTASISSLRITSVRAGTLSGPQRS